MSISCKKQALVTQSLLKELLELRDDGKFYWKISRGRSKAGQPAGTTCSKTGYRIIGVRRKRFTAHRLSILYATGEWPKNRVTHRDGNADNNLPSNLVDTTTAVIMQNRAWSKGPLPPGIKWAKGKFVATISVNGRGMYLGTFSDLAYAERAYKEAKQKYHTILENKDAI